MVYLSCEADAPNGDLEFNIGTGVNTGALTGSTMAISPSAVTNNSSGSSFNAFEVDFPAAVGPLVAGKRYFLNFESKAPNGKVYYLEYSGNNTYPNGTYFKSGSNDGKDMRFQVHAEQLSSNPPPVNLPPVSDAGPDQTVDEGATVTLDGSGSTDPDGSVVAHQWIQLSGPAVVITNPSSETASFTAPDVTADTVVRIRLRVTDDGGTIDRNALNITVNDITP